MIQEFQRDFAKEARDKSIAYANKMANDHSEGASASKLTNHPLVLSSTSGLAGLVPLDKPSTSQAQGSSSHTMQSQTQAKTSKIAHQELQGLTDEHSEDTCSVG